MKLLKSFKYHFFCVAGFVAYVIASLSLEKLAYISTIPRLTPQHVNAKYYFIGEGLTCALLGYVLSNILLFYIERYIDFANITRKKIVGTALVLLVVLVLYYVFLWPILEMLMLYYLDEKTALPTIVKLTNMPYFTTLFAIWLFIIIAIKVYNYLNQVKLSRLELETNLRESQLNTLKGQINPHFMFNSLNNIRGLILEDAPRARDMITRLSEMLRYSLTKNGVNTISLKEELQTVDNYIEISKIQFEGRLQFYIDVSPEALNIAIPPMIIQMLVENAVKHGIGKLKQGGEVRLSISTQNSSLMIEVVNSGQLNLEEGGTRLGLENIKKRLWLIFDSKATFSLTEKDNFVEAKISIPL